MTDIYPDGTVVYVRAVVSNPAPGDAPLVPGDITVMLRDGEGDGYRCEVRYEDVQYAVEDDDDD